MTPQEHYETTGFHSVEECIAYDLGREHEQKVIWEWILNWDYSTNSSMGNMLMQKIEKYNEITKNK